MCGSPLNCKILHLFTRTIKISMQCCTTSTKLHNHNQITNLQKLEIADLTTVQERGQKMMPKTDRKMRKETRQMSHVTSCDIFSAPLQPTPVPGPVKRIVWQGFRNVRIKTSHYSSRALLFLLKTIDLHLIAL